MKDQITKKVEKFLEDHKTNQKKVCLGLSGGPDSIALFHILKNQVNLSIAHVHHGWRKESEKEVKQIQSIAEKWNIPCYTHSLNIDYSSHNLEDLCRKERLSFFYQLYSEKKFDALALAHHANDQAETVLKRIFEGAFLSHIPGLKPCSFYQNMPIWRPLLLCSKEEILDYLRERKIPYVEDFTNLSPRFLRGRMRSDLFPYVEGVFGKSVQKNLCKLANRIFEVDAYLQRRIAKFTEKLKQDAGVISIDFSSFSHLEKIEVEWFVKKLVEEIQDFLSFEQTQKLAHFICSKAYGKKILSKNWSYHAHGGVLNLYKIGG